MAVIYRCDICHKETPHFRSLIFKRTMIRDGKVAEPEASMSLDVCSDLCELQAASDLLRRLSKASSVGEDGRPFRSRGPDSGPTEPPVNRPSWDHLSPHRRPT